VELDLIQSELEETIGKDQLEEKLARCLDYTNYYSERKTSRNFFLGIVAKTLSKRYIQKVPKDSEQNSRI
jgi:hypothetical protein